MTKKLFKKVLKEYGLCPRDAYDRRQREIDRENRDTLAESDLYDVLATEFMEDKHFRKTPGCVKFGLPWSNDYYFLISYEIDNLSQIKVSLYYKTNSGKLERASFKTIYRSNDLIDDIYKTIAELAED